MTLTEERLIAYLNQSFEFDYTIRPDTELFSSGLLDSVMMANLIMFLEDGEGTQVDPADVNLDNFDTPARIMSYVERSR